MEKVRKPFQGILNIISFNWHFYAIAFFFITILFFSSTYANHTIKHVLFIVSIIMLSLMFISLFVSFYIYDLSGFYAFKWIDDNDDNISLVNINAGFDETTEILKTKFINATFLSLDFYNSTKHTEVSIKRARKKYPPNPNTKIIDSTNIELKSNSTDKIFVILSAHEIRKETERVVFFSELKRIIKPNGQIIVVEHLRDFPNFIAYTIGFFHFYSKSSWLTVFNQSNLNVISEIKNTPFISTFILEKNGNTF